ncbi:melanocyte-stimulating hormone receptor-like [Paramuricea clavata]|uniref:Melanocyte-stimulating hormone receptor-like n=1 Tax=Paramuricea clavata TaxID=317549 RepID=A0A7D9D9N7_PARCT|nr:melanocyte-stimulating hormone receptor-like [Paramuricea clavata]
MTVLMILLLTTYAYTRIFLAIRHLRFSGDKIGDCSTGQSSSNLERKRSLQEQKFAKSCALVVVINYLCYFPSIVSYLYFKDDPVNFRVSHSWSMTVYALNSILNSVIFFWKRPLLREEALKVLRDIL